MPAPNKNPNFVIVIEEDELAYLLCCTRAMNRFLEGADQTSFPAGERRINLVRYLETRLSVRRQLNN